MRDEMWNEEWHPIGHGHRLSCPLCPWYVDEPPGEARTVQAGDTIKYEARRRDATPVAVLHVLTDHPLSGLAAEILTALDRLAGDQAQLLAGGDGAGLPPDLSGSYPRGGVTP